MIQIDIPMTESLRARTHKSIKVKLNDKDGKELVGHYWYPNDTNRVG